jgi:5-dehydro-2-deoxygluconokinase
LGIEPPDKFPLVYYRDNCADNQLSIDDVLETPIQDCRVFEFSGTGLGKEPSRSATIFAAEQARAAGATVVLDLDFRPNQWHDARAFGVTVRSALPVVHIVLGTEDECKAVTLTDPTQVDVTHSQISGARVAGDLDAAVEAMRRRGPKVVVVKRGEKGATVFEAGMDPSDVPGFPVEIYNVLGAGDAFAAGFIYGLVKNWDYFKAARMGNACGAIVVTKHGCANFMPTMPEIEAFMCFRKATVGQPRQFKGVWIANPPDLRRMLTDRPAALQHKDAKEYASRLGALKDKDVGAKPLVDDPQPEGDLSDANDAALGGLTSLGGFGDFG